jgi:hypothetical protein
MSDKDSKQHSSTGVGGSNDPAANPGQDKPAPPPTGDGDKEADRKPGSDKAGG